VSVEMRMLTLSVVLGIVQIIAASHTASLQRGYRYAKTVEEFMEFLYRNELMGEEARLELRDEIRRLKRKLETAEETVDAIHSGLERMES
jgi:hypothetical protein